jgi:prepilin-type N-terminal cleavage/methylation domain-containing protein/prepilin-type processing-associated H-X9-DG protein
MGRTEVFRRRGFTLIELLVVIAIIGILAAMLFPVFARARESARKIQCLSNVKNIALGVQMYLTDYDRFPPKEHRQEVIDGMGCSTYPTLANPYLRWPVLLDEYVKNKDVYRCPSAKQVYKVMWVLPGLKDWYAEYQEGWICACQTIFPSGWGGAITDSRAINTDCPISAADDPGSVELDIQPSETVNYEKSTSEINDVAKYIVVAERGIQGNWSTVEQIAYPELCRVTYQRKGCSTCGNCDDGWAIDERGCTIAKSDIDRFWSDASWRSQYTRHLGGNNLGFADGHAKWWTADAMIAGIGDWRNPHPSLEGVSCHCLLDNPSCQGWS